MPLSSAFLHTVAGTARVVVTQFWTRQRVKSEVSRFASSRKCSKIKGGSRCGRVAQLGEHLLCKQGVTGSIPVTSTIFIEKKAYRKTWGPLKLPRCYPQD